MKRKLFGAVAALFMAAATLGIAGQAVALPEAPEPAPPVTGIPDPCAASHPWPGDDSSMDEIKAGITKNFGFQLEGALWTESNRESVKILWQTLDAVGCTTFVGDLQDKVDGKVGLNAANISGFAWGDWSLTRGNYVTLDFSKFQQAIDSGDKGRLTRLIAHELTHVLNSDRHSEPAYWAEFKSMHAKRGAFSDYAAGSVTETFADTVGYYVGRCAMDNPYDTGNHDAYYEFVKKEVFDGKEFGPEPGVAPECDEPSAPAAAPDSEMHENTSWVDAVSGE